MSEENGLFILFIYLFTTHYVALHKPWSVCWHSLCNRVRTGHGKPGKTWNFWISFSRPEKSWKMKFIVRNKFSRLMPFLWIKRKLWGINLIYFTSLVNNRLNLGQGKCVKVMEKVLEFQNLERVRTLCNWSRQHSINEKRLCRVSLLLNVWNVK